MVMRRWTGWSRSRSAGSLLLLRRRLVSVGQTLPGIELEIRDDEGRVLGPGERGEIYVRGEQVSGEYEGRGSVVDSEGWFPTLESVPTLAISMSIQQILKSKSIICTVPDERKALAVRNATQGEVTNQVPASILQNHPDCHLFLDDPAASRL